MSTVTLDRPTFDRTLQQRYAALDRANDVRSRRAAWKRDVKAGRRLALDVLLSPPWWAESMKVVDVLLAVPKVGRVKASKTLRRGPDGLPIPPGKALGALSDRQRQALAEALR